MNELSPQAISEIIAKLLNNEVLILPTDTIYGLSLLVQGNEPTILNTLKKADLNKPVLILIADFKSIESLVESNEESLEILNSSTPTTVIFPLKNSSKTLAVRICQRQDIREILTKTGPIYSTSVNLTGQDPLTTQADLINFLQKPENVYWVGPLENQPSRIYNSLNQKWVR